MPQVRCAGPPVHLRPEALPECPQHPRKRQHPPKGANARHYTYAWQRAARAAIAAHIEAHGYSCPGWGVPPHPARDLTGDHPTALKNGGAPLPETINILCRSCNSRKRDR